MDVCRSNTDRRSSQEDEPLSGRRVGLVEKRKKRKENGRMSSSNLITLFESEE